MAGWNCPKYKEDTRRYSDAEGKLVETPVYNCGSCVNWVGTCSLRVGWVSKVVQK